VSRYAHRIAGQSAEHVLDRIARQFSRIVLPHEGALQPPHSKGDREGRAAIKKTAIQKIKNGDSKNARSGETFPLNQTLTRRNNI